jgi:hypothetical protein
MAQVVELLPSKHKALSSNSSTAKKKRKKISCQVMKKMEEPYMYITM